MNHSNSFSPNNPPAGSPGVPPPSGTPDNRWDSVFQDASEAPPARVWSGIERQLDLDDEDGVLPLYPYAISRSVMFGRWAAGVAAALLLALLGWWSLYPTENKPLADSTITTNQQPAIGQKTGAPKPSATQRTDSGATVVTTSSDRYATAKTSQNQLTRTRLSGAVHRAATPPDAMAEATVPREAKSSPIIDQADDEVSETISVQVQQTIRPANTNGLAIQPTIIRPASLMPAPTTETQLAFSQTTRHSFFRSTSSSATVPPPTKVAERAAESQGAVAATVVMANSPLSEEMVSASRNASGIQPMSIRTVSVQFTGNERIIWFSPEHPDLGPKQKMARKSKPKAWVSAGVVAASFDPSVALRAVSGLAYTNNSPSNALVSTGPVPALALDSHAGRAIAMQASVGVPLSERWTIETGLGYINGQSTVQSPVRTSALSTEKNGANLPTLYTDLVGNSANSSVNSAADMQYNTAVQRYAFVASTSYDRAVSQSVSNNYQFVQVPVQLSYELRPRRKFGLALLTGMVSNLFVRNTVADAVTVKAQDGVYRPLTVAGTAGMRLRFRPDKHWSASLAGTFQQSLQSITRPEVGVQASPQNMGVCFSIDRHF
jgi:hypothetical protein